MPKQKLLVPPILESMTTTDKDRFVKHDCPRVDRLIKQFYKQQIGKQYDTTPTQ